MKKLNINYSLILASYDVVFASVWAYVTVFLMSRALNEFVIGILIASANILAVIIQPILADKADKSFKWTLYHFVLLLFIPAFLLLALVLIDSIPVWLTALAYLLAMALFTAASPLLNSIAMVLVNNGYPINYGMSRSLGSLSFGITTSLVGTAIVSFGVNSIVVTGMLGLVIIITALTVLNQNYLKEIFTDDYQEVKYNSSQVAFENNNRRFFHKYPGFLFLVIGSFFLFISQNIISYYMINIVNSVGGNEVSMGVALSVASFAEVPAMFFYSKFANRFGHERMLLISTFFFLARITLMFLASSIYVLYLAQLMQSGGYGFYIIASVYYPNEIMEYLDKVKGQAFLTTAGTLGGVVGSLMGGLIINAFSIKHALLFGVICSTLGVALHVYSLRDFFAKPRNL